MDNKRRKKSMATQKNMLPIALKVAMGVGTLTAASCVVMHLTADFAEASTALAFGNGNYTIISAANNKNTQKLYLEPVGNGNYYFYTNKGSNIVLGVESDGSVKAQVKSSGKAQEWRIDTSGDGRSYFFVNVKNNKALDFSSGTIQSGKAKVVGLNGDNSQKFLVNSEDRVVADGWYKIGSANNSNYVLDVVNNDPSNGANVQIYQTANTNAQKFYIRYLGKGEYVIATGSSGGKSLIELAGGKVQTSTNIQQYMDNNTEAQRWRITKATDGTYIFTSAKSGYNMEFFGGNIAPENNRNVLVGGRTGLGNQRFVLTKTSLDSNNQSGGNNNGLELSKENFSDKSFTIQSAINEKYQLEITNSSIVNKTNVQLWEIMGLNNRKFRFENAGNGYYRLIARNSEKALAVSNSNVEQQTVSSSDAQLWKIYKSSDGKMVLQNKTGGYLSVDKASNGVNVGVSNSYEGVNQKFVFSQTSYAPDIKTGEYSILAVSNTNAGLTVENSSSAGGVRIISVNNSVFSSNAHKFNVTHLGDGIYTIKTAISSYNSVFDVKGGKVADGTTIQQYPSNNSNAQKWRIIRTEDNKYIFMSLKGNKVITINGDAGNAPVSLGTLGDRNVKQQFTFTNPIGSSSGNDSNNSTSAEPLTEYKGNINGKTFNIFSGVNKNYQLEITNSSSDNNAVVQIWSNSGTNNRKFRFESAGNGYYRIIARNSEKAITVKGNTIVQQAVALSDDQLWKVYTSKDGKYVIQNKNGRYLSVNGASNGLDASADTTMGGNGQKFFIEGTGYNQEVANGNYRITSAANTGTSLTVENASSAGGVRIISVNNDVFGETAHQFNVSYTGDGLYKITTAMTGNKSAVDIAGGRPVDGTTIQQYPDNGSDAQRWRIIRTEDNKYIFMSKSGNKVITINNDPINSPVTVSSQNDTNKKQQFTFVSVSGGSTNTTEQLNPVNSGLDGKTFNIQSGVNSSYQLEITNSSIKENTEAQLWANSGTNNRKFRFESAGNGYYKIIARNSEKALAVMGNKVVQQTYTGTSDQLWKVYTAKDGKYVIQNKNGKYLSVNKAENGFDATVETTMGGNGQKFSLSSTSYLQEIKDGAYNLVSVADSNGLLTIENASQYGGARLISSWKSSANNASQIFGVTYLGDGQYKIKTGPSVYKSTLDIVGGKVENGGGIQQYPDNGSAAQTWRIIRTEDDKYIFMSLNGNKVITINESATNSKTSLNGMGDDNKSQQFTFARASGYLVRGDRKYYFNENGATPKVGIDISQWQSNIDWEAVKADGIDFAIIRVAYSSKASGFGFEDPYAKRNIEECERLGIPYGVYLYSMAITDEQADDEADFMVDLLRGHSPKMGAFIDIEDTSRYEKAFGSISSDNARRRITDLTKRIVDRVKSRGVNPGIYANENYFRNILYSNELEGVKWIAKYYYSNDSVLPINSDWKMWQYSSSGSVKGIKGDVDMNTLISEY